MTDRGFGSWTSVVVIAVSAVAVASGASVTSVASAKAKRPVQARITATLVLDQTHVRPGGAVGSELVIQNSTSKTANLLSACGVLDGFYVVGLRAPDGYIQEPAFTTVGCGGRQEMIAEPGRTVYRFKVKATYTACSQTAKDRPPKRSRYWNPLCLKDSSGKRDIMPPLPPGEYTALFFPDGQWKGPAVKSAKLIVS